jgi:hypothetical protein
MPSHFDEKWLADYKKKRAESLDHIRLPDVIEFELRLLLKLPNTLSGRHWSVHMKQRAKLAPMMDLVLRPYLGCLPLERAAVTITRYSTGSTRPDWDNLFASAKPLIDLLLVRSDRHPHSFGLIIDDDPKRLMPYMFAERCEKRTEQKTHVKIERR